MEVAESQWRREWAGTAEYGKVVEGGVTRRVARAMEVMHASGPGAKVRVMRAAYHSSAGPGLPASSYMMHASRRVFTSGFNFLEPSPSIPTKPLEISSMPFDSTPDLHIDTDTENYKVTEPDDFEISEPSKWKSSKGGNMRMPSEESSSTDNASIIDLDPRTSHKNILRKYSYDSENSDIIHSGRSSRVSPLLDAPVSLSTLKFKSLLNGSNDWNSRRKSYSFEDTSPCSESILHSNDTLAMESSTDSGICKSTEIVNDHSDDNAHLRSFDSKERDINKHDDSFQSWLSKNRQNNNYYKGSKFKTYREHEVVTEDPEENNITLQSRGRVSITLPVRVETDDGYHYQKNDISEDGQRKIKKVEFCKTELHFAVDTGKVNIIATDEKPPPTNDFRKRRSAFVPMHEMNEKPVTLFGEKVNDFPDMSQKIESLKHAFNELNESDENTAATKSILKNKIPKPKPYLLGENMTFGTEDISNDGNLNNVPQVLTAVSLINRQLHSENVCDKTVGFLKNNAVSLKTEAFGTTNQGPPKSSIPNDETFGFKAIKSQKVVKIREETNTLNSLTNVRSIKRSPTPGIQKTRELRDSDLTYFGIDSQPKAINKDKLYNRRISIEDSDQDEFQSVRLIQQVSNSVCNSESEDGPEYINIPFNTSYAPVPIPRIRSKFDDKPNQIDEIKVLKPIIEHVHDIKNDDTATRRSRFRRQEELSFNTSRSVSEPRKSYKHSYIEKPHRLLNQPTRCIKEQNVKENSDAYAKLDSKKKTHKDKVSEDVSHMYANLNKPQENNAKKHIFKTDSDARKTAEHDKKSKIDSTVHRSRKLETPTSSLSRTEQKYVPRKSLKNSENRDTLENKNKKCGAFQTDNNSKIQSSNTRIKQTNNNLYDTKKSHDTTKRKDSHNDNINKIEDHKKRSTQKHTTKDAKESNGTDSFTRKKDSEESKATTKSETNNDYNLINRKKESGKEKTNTIFENVKIIPKVDNSTIDKSSTSRDAKPRNISKTRKNEYVINYDDKNGTVSSVRKVRSGSDSPRRKKITKDVEKFKENLKDKTSEKAALLQSEDHQRNVKSKEETKLKSRMHKQRTCQML